MATLRGVLLALTVITLLAGCGVAESPPRMVEEPKNTVVIRHQPATLECRAEGDPPPSILWYKDGLPLAHGGVGGPRRVLLPAGGLFFLRTTHARRDTDQGTYWCEASNRLGTARSRNATLTVAVLREDFRLEPADTRGATGDSALMECAPPRGSPEPAVIWKKNGEEMDIENSDRINIVDGGNLVIQDLRTSDDGRYQCIAKNIVGVRESAIARLRVHIKPYLINGPEDVTVINGKTVTFECRVGGDPLPDVLWRRTADGGNMPLGRVHILEDRSLQLDSVTVQDQGDYICEADNTVGTVSAWGSLTVQSLPTVNLQPDQQILEEGNDAVFECSTEGMPNPNIYWSIEGNSTLIFPGSMWERFVATNLTNGSSKLTLRNISKADTYLFVVCSAINLAGSAISSSKLLVTTEDERPPPVIVLGPSNQTLPHKSRAVLPCSATGNPEPIISWYYKGAPVMPDDRIEISDTGSVTIKDLNNDDSGTYTCVASSKNGKSIWTSTLLVDAPTNPSVHFFRGPEMSSLPGPPSKPSVTTKSSRSVTISWSQNNKIGSSSLLGYQVEMFGRDNTDKGRFEAKWIRVARRLQGTSYTQRFLDNDVNCIFLVRAENSHGFSPPSELSETIIFRGDEDFSLGGNTIAEAGKIAKLRNNLKSNDIVKLLEAIAIESTSVKLVWKTMNTYHLEGFYIYFRPLDHLNISAIDYKMVTLFNSGTTVYEVNGLLKFTQYEFFLTPFYKSIEGKSSNTRIVRTLEAVPDAPPTDLEASPINSTSVLLKWRPPPEGTHNGVIQCYQIIVKEAGNESAVIQNVSVVGSNARVNGLTPGSAYWLQLAAATVRGIGPYTHHAKLQLPYVPTHGLDPSTRLLDPNDRKMRHDIQTVVSGDLLTETWFLALLGSMLTIMTLLFMAMLFVRRRHLMMKENPLPNLYDSRSGSKNLVNHMNIKAAIGLPHPIATSYQQNGNVKTDSLLWVKSRPDSWRDKQAESWRRGDKEPEYGQITLPEYDKINGNMPDYAEVDASMISFSKDGCVTPNSPAAYASVTLVPSPGNTTGSVDWTNRSAQSSGTGNKNQVHDEEIYPASNGGYFNRNLFTESYFTQQNSNISKFGNGPRNDKSNLSLHSEHYAGNAKPRSQAKDQTFSLPQNHFGTARRSHRQQKISKFDNKTNDNVLVNGLRNESYQINFRMQENPTFGLPDGKCEVYLDEDGEQFCLGNIPPMVVMNHQYSRPANVRSSPNDSGGVRAFASFKAKNKETEYHTSTRSEPGNNL